MIRWLFKISVIMSKKWTNIKLVFFIWPDHMAQNKKSIIYTLLSYLRYIV